MRLISLLTLDDEFEVSIHAPREGCDDYPQQCTIPHIVFQFTHPGRGATLVIALSSELIESFNSRTPGGVRLDPNKLLPETRVFQFTHPGRGATRPVAILRSGG